ncbi:hypothetical protein D3C71_1798060 [compost metagenome]
MAGHMDWLHVQPQIKSLACGCIQKGLQQRFAEVFDVHPLRRLCVQAACVRARQRQQLVRELRSAAGGVAQLLDLINS